MPAGTCAGTITDPMKPSSPVTRARVELPFSRWVSLLHESAPPHAKPIDAPGWCLMPCHVRRRAARDGGRMLTTENPQLGGAAASRFCGELLSDTVALLGISPFCESDLRPDRVGEQRRPSRPVVRKSGACRHSASSRLRTPPQQPKRTAWVPRCASSGSSWPSSSRRRVGLPTS